MSAAWQENGLFAFFTAETDRAALERKLFQNPHKESGLGHANPVRENSNGNIIFSSIADQVHPVVDRHPTPRTMVRRAQVAGSTRVYDISGHAGSQLGPTLTVGHRSTAAEKRAKRKEQLAQRETELLDSFEFPSLSTRIKQTRDERFIFASGVYAPQIHVYDTTELSLKFKRHVDAEIVDFQILEDDWRKFALLTVDRYVDLHSPFGSHYRTRVPRTPRDLLLHRGTADLYIVGAHRDAWRLNLAQGRFLAPLQTGRAGINVCAQAPTNQILAFGGDDGTVEIWDPRVAGRNGARAAGMADVSAHVRTRYPRVPHGAAITAVRFDERDGVTMAVGTEGGHALLYDLRSSNPVLLRDQGYGLPVHTLRLLHDGKNVLSSDAKSIKVWSRRDGKNSVTIEPDANVNHVCVMGRSGVLCAAVEAPRVRSYYVPQLGTAPKWCAFLDTFTEELESEAHEGKDESGQVYENFKFVGSKSELEELGLGELIGTDMLKPMAHGFFVPMKLYRRAVEESVPFAYEKYQLEQARKKMEKERESRISKVRTNKKVKVNKKVAERLLEAGRKKGKKAKVAASIMDDPRFSAMFEKEEFAVDEEAERFKLLNPSGVSAPTTKDKEEVDDDSDEEYLEQFTLVDEEKRDDEGEDESSDEDEEEDDADEVENEVEDEAKKIRKERSKRKGKRTKMYEIGEGAQVLGAKRIGAKKGAKVSKAVRDKVPIGARLQGQ